MKYLYLAEKPSAMKAVKAAYEASNKPLGDIDFLLCPVIYVNYASQSNMTTGTVNGKSLSFQ